MPTSLLLIEDPVFRTLIEKYAHAQCILRRIPRRDAEDVVQDVLLTIHKCAPSYREEKGDVITWAEAVAWKVIDRRVRDATRYAKRFAPYNAKISEYPAPGPSPERCARRKQAARCISHALATISGRHRDVFLLRVVDKHTHEEIAEELGISPLNSAKCFERARADLRQCLDGKAFVAMPSDVAGCNDSKSRFQWDKWSHYTAQIAGAIMALLLFTPSNEPPITASKVGEIRAYASIKNTAMYYIDKRFDVHDEPTMLRDAPSVKPEPAPPSKVPGVSGPAVVVGKGPSVAESARLPPFKPDESSSSSVPLSE